MSTRAMYTFKDEHQTIHVFKHHDGYPEGGISWIANARPYAWDFPRFEADEFAGAFVHANKEGPGGIRLCHGKNHAWEYFGDCEYWYQISHDGKNLIVEVFETNWWDKPTSERIFKGALDEAIAKFDPQWIV